MTEETFDQMARRFGLRTSAQVDLTRHGATARFHWAPDLSTPEGRHAAFCLCFGTRLGLDLLAHDAPKGVGDLEWIQRLIPRTTTRVAEAISGVEVQSSPWLAGVGLDIVFTRETGKLLVAATVNDEVHPDNARRALFYSAYKLRPSATTRLPSGHLLHYETTGGLASSVASLLPDFDLDAAREQGAFAVPGYDRLLVFRPDDVSATGDGAELRRIVRESIADTPRPVSQRLYSLRRSRIIPAEVCGPTRDFDAAHLIHNLIEVVHD